MTPRPLATALCLALAACGGNLYQSLNSRSTLSAPDAFGCARAQLKTLGYSQTSIDETDRRVTVKKLDESVHRSDTQFRYLVHRIVVQALPAADGNTDLQVEAHTFARYETQKGPEEREESASSVVKSDVGTVLDKCAQPAGAGAVPQVVPPAQ